MTFGTGRDLSSQVVAIPMTSFGIVMNFVLMLAGSGIVAFIVLVLLGQDWHSSGLDELFRAVGNSLIGAVAFPLLDRTQVRD